MIFDKCGIATYTPIPQVHGPNGPRLAMVTTEWHRAEKAMVLPTNFAQITLTVDGMEVGAARCKAVDMAMAHDPRPEFLFSLDYDVLPAYDAITKLVYRARCFPDYDIFAGVYCAKGSPPDPLIYKGNGTGPFWDWTVGDLLTEGITGCHMGLTLIRMSLFDRMEYSEDNPLFVTNEKHAERREDGGLSYRSNTEDLFFTRRAIEEAGAKILIDTSVLAGHINHQTGQVFGLLNDSPPIQRCTFMGGKKPKKKGLKLCLDIGAGTAKRTWEGYKTYTLDIRPECEPDFQQDSRLLNFPDGHWDMVASAHHLEHVGRWDQEKVWSEMFRILKPGGTMEHIVPNIEWAAWKVTDGQTDEHAFNVLYGAQEEHGYDRDLNTHYFGYTPQVARELAEHVGLVDVKTVTYKERPELGYNLIVSGRKPAKKRKRKKK
jgi:SAM-dependent methyltransferase